MYLCRESFNGLGVLAVAYLFILILLIDSKNSIGFSESAVIFEILHIFVSKKC